jgi:L-ascorbate metabolism protein UlaG (beta-lactamase superfamily)
MSLSHVSISIEPNGFNRDLAFPVILELLRSGFSADSISRIEQILERLRIPSDLLRLESLHDGGLLATEKYLYPHADSWLIKIAVRDVQAAHQDIVEARIDDFILKPEEFAQVMTTLRQGAPWFEISQTRLPPTITGEYMVSTLQVLPLLQALQLPVEHTDNAFRIACAGLDPALAKAFDHASAAAASSPNFTPADGPGIYRREHASLLIRSSSTAVLVDPISLWRGYANLWNAPTKRERQVDAILITHGHADHFNVPSVAFAAGGMDVPIIVPHVPRPNCLGRFDMAAALKSFGLRSVHSPQWWSTMRIGDIEIDILPFYGEQPTRDGPGAPPAVRNWGNCYRVNTPEFSALILADSGTDPAGSMEDVIRMSYQRRGRPDALLTSLPVFLSPFFGGLMNHYLTVPVDRLRALFEDFKSRSLPSVTPGPEGVPALCAAAQARYYLPYGNGMGLAVGKCVTDVSGEGQPDESVLIGEIQAELDARSIPARAISWNPGDAVDFANGELLLRPYNSDDSLRKHG